MLFFLPIVVAATIQRAFAMEAIAIADGGAVDRRRSHATQLARRDTKAQAKQRGGSQT